MQVDGASPGARVEARLAGGLLLVGGVLFLIGASAPPLGVFSGDVHEHLRTVAAHRGRWLVNAAGMGSGAIVTLFGLVLLTQQLRERGDRVLSTLAIAAMAFGTVLWTVSLAFRLSLTDWAASELAATGAVPVGYAAWWHWAGLLAGAYILLGWVALTAWGAAFLTTRAMPRWLGLGSLIAGAAGTLLVTVPLLAGGPTPPFLLYLMPLVAGVVLLRESKGRAPA